LIVSHALWTSTVYDGKWICGNGFSTASSTDACGSALGDRRAGAGLMTALSLGAAALAFYLRWGALWTEWRLSDAD